eukprot:TRINITY_DN4799_c0_g1_i3.p1 TRINITY_DN4799_c0_g1~~TRINITY_DN4799_c0_g1_i3.p1  ORF type:complete len:219 (-),score=26.14 TRINITY_DN4799_c0_g1_i3:111-767(-)
MSFLILGGAGFVGRNLVQFLLAQPSVVHIRVADKRSWDSEVSNCFFSAEHQRSFSDRRVECIRTDLRSVPGTQKAFEGFAVDFVINLADDTDDEATDDDYQMRLVEILRNAVTVSKEVGRVRRFIELSTTAVYLPEKKKPCTEESKIEPFTTKARFKLVAEEVLQSSGIPHVIFRAPFIYGPGCTRGIMSRVVVGKVYQLTRVFLFFLVPFDQVLSFV